MVIAHRCVQHDSENDMCEYEYYLLLMLCVRPKSAEQKALEKKIYENDTKILLLRRVSSSSFEQRGDVVTTTTGGGGRRI